MNEAIHIGAERQLFLDGHLIQWRDKLRRRVCPMRKHPDNPLIRPVGDWEPQGYATYGSVIYDEEQRLYKAWCAGSGEPWAHRGEDHPVTKGIYYFTSADGIRWDRPALDVIPIDGRPTNIVALCQSNAHAQRWPNCYELFGVSRDPDEPDPARRYKMGYLYLHRGYHGPLEDPFHPGSLRALGVAFSPDGMHWTDRDEPVTLATCDGATHWLRDPASGRWIMYGRTRHFDPQVLALHGEDLFFQRQHSGRSVRRSESRDFMHWEPERGELVLAADTLDGPGDEIYGMSVFPYEGIYIALLQMFHNYPDRVYLDVQLAVSRDSVHFQRLSDRSPFIPVGEAGEWDRFNQSLANNPPLLVGDELRFYYGGRNYLHSGAHKGPDDGRHADLRFRAGVGLGSVKLDRFAAMQATFDTGTLVTRPLVFEGGRLRVNAAVEFGALEVSLLDANGDSIEGMRARITGLDGTDLPVPMDGLGRLAGRPSCIRFDLQNGNLYSFWIE